MEIHQIIEGAQKKQPTCEKALYKLLFENLFKVPLAYCSDKEEATGVFNFSLVYIFDHLKMMPDKNSLLKWAHRIIKNDCIDHVRKKTVYRNKLLNVKASSTSISNSNEAISNLRMEEILNCINQLKDAHRLCFVMFELDGFSHEEIAKKLKINKNTSKWYLAEAKKELRKIISRNDIIEHAKSDIK